MDPSFLLHPFHLVPLSRVFISKYHHILLSLHSHQLLTSQFSEPWYLLSPEFSNKSGYLIPCWKISEWFLMPEKPMQSNSSCLHQHSVPPHCALLTGICQKQNRLSTATREFVMLGCFLPSLWPLQLTPPLISSVNGRCCFTASLSIKGLWRQ